MFEVFPIRAAVFIINISEGTEGGDGKPLLHHIKKAIIQTLTRLETDDRMYVYNPDGELEMDAFPAASVASVANFRSAKINLPVAVKEAVYLVNQIDNAHRAVFIFTEVYDTAWKALLTRSFRYSREKSIAAKFYFYGFGPVGLDFLESLSQGYDNEVFYRAIDEEDKIYPQFSKDFLNS